MAKEQLSNAKKLKNDEFYTRRQDIEEELSHYIHHFKGKTVYCNCDDPEYSEFWKFFVRNFKPFGLKRLICTHYETDAKNYAYRIEINEGDDISLDMVPERIPIQSNGDFRSQACIELLKQADVVVTNPPFSLFREYVAQLVEYKKQFIIMGNKNAITYKEIFPLLKENRMWVGATSLNGGRWMIIPKWIDVQSPKAKIDSDGNTILNVAGVCWFTNIDIPKCHQMMDLRGNYYTPEKYPTYDNLNAIEVSKTDDIPCDYDGMMGVPITFMNKYNSEQFEIVGFWNTGNAGEVVGAKMCEAISNGKKIVWNGPTVNGVTKYFRILIRRRK